MTKFGGFTRFFTGKLKVKNKGLPRKLLKINSFLAKSRPFYKNSVFLKLPITLHVHRLKIKIKVYFLKNLSFKSVSYGVDHGKPFATVFKYFGT